MSTIGSDYRVNRKTKAISRVLSEGTALALTVIEADVDLVEDQHQAALLTVTSSDSSMDFASLPGKRVEFDYGFLGDSAKFQGYFYSVTPQQKVQDQRVIDTQLIQCLGPSMVFKANIPRFFSDMTCTQALQRIVNESQLGFNDEYRNDYMIWRSLAQTDESDWQMIIYLADRLGCSVVMSRGVVRLIDYKTVMSREMPTRSYRRAENMPSFATPIGAQANRILEFTPSNATATDPFYTPTSMAYLAGQQAVAVPQDPTPGQRFIPQFRTDLPARSADEAEQIQNGYYIPDWVQEADVTLLGDAVLEPGVNISIANRASRGNVKRPQYDGMWYVREVHHEVTNQRFLTKLHVARTGDRAYNVRQPIPFWIGDKRGVPSMRPSGDGQWLSSWRGVP
jgi:hypothetical protein